MIDPLKPLLVMPEVAEDSKWKTGKVWFVDPQEHFIVGAFSSVATLLFINTEHVKADELRQMKDLLNPKWRGKISTEDPTTTGAGANKAARLYVQIGEEFLKNLVHRSEDRAHPRTAPDDRLAGARHPADLLDCREDDVRPLAKDGFKVLEIFGNRRHTGPTINGSPWNSLSGEQGAAPEGGAGFRQLDSLQGRLGDLCQGLRLGDPAHGYRRVVSQPRQSAEKGREIFRTLDWKWIVGGRHENREKVWKLLKNAK